MLELRFDGQRDLNKWLLKLKKTVDKFILVKVKPKKTKLQEILYYILKT